MPTPASHDPDPNANQLAAGHTQDPSRRSDQFGSGDADRSRHPGPAVLWQEPLKRKSNRRFSRTAFPDQRDDFARRHAEADLVQDAEGATFSAEHDRKILYDEDRLSHGHHGMPDYTRSPASGGEVDVARRKDRTKPETLQTLGVNHHVVSIDKRDDLAGIDVQLAGLLI